MGVLVDEGDRSRVVDTLAACVSQRRIGTNLKDLMAEATAAGKPLTIQWSVQPALALRRLGSPKISDGGYITDGMAADVGELEQVKKPSSYPDCRAESHENTQRVHIWSCRTLDACWR